MNLLRCVDESRRSGHTILEIVIVLLVIGILAAAGAPRYFQSLANQRVESAARRVKLDLEFVQRRAKTRGTSQTIVFDDANSTYTLVDVNDLDRPTETYTVDLKKAPYEAAVLSVDLGGDDEIEFDGYGLPDSDASIVLVVGSTQRVVNVDAESGQVTIL